MKSCRFFVNPFLRKTRVADHLLSPRYIYFSGKAPWFWQALVGTLSAEEATLGSRDICDRYWPRLKGVIRTEALMNVEIPKSVWLTIRGAHHENPTTESPVAKVVKIAYKAWNIANVSPPLIPKFVSHYPPIEDSYKHAVIPYRPEEKTRRDVPDTQNRPRTTLQHFQLDCPDATLQVDMVFEERTLDFYILSDIIMDADEVFRLTRVLAIWKTFHQVQRHFVSSKLTFALERCWIFHDVLAWLKMVSTCSRYWGPSSVNS